MINPVDVADNIKRSGGFIPGIRPGKRTAEFIDHVLSRVTLIGAIYVASICLIPVMLAKRFGVPFYFGGTALLIVVGVGLDLIGQIEAHLVTRQYEGFVGGGAHAREDRAMTCPPPAAAGPAGRGQGHPGQAPGGRACACRRSRRATCCARRSPRAARSGGRPAATWTPASWSRTRS